MSKRQYSAWNPGLKSQIPVQYRELETLYRPENSFTRFAEVTELSRMTGLKPPRLVAFRPERLVIHELIIRVTADIAGLEGDDEEDLGHNFRQIVTTILNNYIQPVMAEIRETHTRLCDQISQRAETELSTLLATSPGPPEKKQINPLRFFSRKSRCAELSAVESIQERDYHLVKKLRQQRQQADTPLDRAFYRSLYQVLGTTASTRGYIGNDIALMARLVAHHLCAGYGSQLIGRKIAPRIDAAITQENYSRVRNATKPVLISLKGASAAGKSSLRPMLKELLRRKGVEPDQYGIISPDIWRRFLLDYESLGEARKYAGQMTSNEVNIIDRKLDHYIRTKAHRSGSIPHLLVDRFRFDSFASEQVSHILHDTYVKYVDTLYMYFIVTPPEATVERGWERGLSRGRYKSVEDFLGHCVEACEGIPRIFFKWLAYDHPLFRYVFLDNDVPVGTPPKEIARGNQKEMILYSPLAFINLERYQKINTNAPSPADVHPSDNILKIHSNISFLKKCVQLIPVVQFADEHSHQPFARFENRSLIITDKELFRKKIRTDRLREIFEELQMR